MEDNLFSKAFQDNDEEEENFINEDEQLNILNNIEDPEEVDAAEEIFSEKLSETIKELDNSLKNSEEPSKEEETSSEEKEELETETATNTTEEGKKEEKFIITDEFINSQPEENQKILKNFKDKNLDDLAKAAANAIAMKDPYLKGNDNVINSIANELINKGKDELIKTFIDTQKNVGRSPIDNYIQPIKSDTPEKLPDIPDNDPKIKSIIDEQVLKRLKTIYPDMPDDVNSYEYKEWEKDLQDEKGIRGVEKYLRDIDNIENQVKKDIQKVVYAQTYLPNLYVNSPEEILPLFNEDNYQKLKNINDNYIEINNKTLQEEVELIKNELKKYGIEESDIGANLSLTKDNNGGLYNEELNNLLYNDNEIDKNVVGYLGKVPLLKKGQLANKFLTKNNFNIINKMVENKNKNDKIERERIKEGNLTQVKGANNIQSNKVITMNDINNETDPNKLDKILAELSKKFG